MCVKPSFWMSNSIFHQREFLKFSTRSLSAIFFFEQLKKSQTWQLSARVELFQTFEPKRFRNWVSSRTSSTSSSGSRPSGMWPYALLETCFLKKKDDVIIRNKVIIRAWIVKMLERPSSISMKIITRAWTVQNKNEPSIFSSLNQNTIRWFQASFRRVLGVLVTWWCLVNFAKSEKHKKSLQKS